MSAIEMARRIAATCPGPVLSPRCQSAMLRGECDDWHGVQAALAAILEMQSVASLGELGSRDQAPHPSASSMQTAIETGNRALPVQTRLAAIDTPAPLECPDDLAALRIATREFIDAVIEALRIPKMLDWLTARLR